MQINMLGVFTDQYQAMKEFYSEVLEFEILEELESYVEFGGQPVRFAICERKIMLDITGDVEYAKPSEGSPFEFAFECASREELENKLETLVSKGARKVKDPAEMPWGQYTGFFADPDGHVHELFYRIPK